MEHNLQQHRGQLLLNPSYCASPVFLSGIGWEVESSGDILIDKATDENTVACVVGHLKEHHFFVTPNGNYSTVEYGDFSHTKFHFVIGNPECTLFAEDFLKALDVISKLQAQIASTPNRVNFIASAGRSKVLRFTRPVFKKRVRLLLDSCGKIFTADFQITEIDRTFFSDSIRYQHKYLTSCSQLI